MSPGMEVSSPGLSSYSSFLSRWVQNYLWARSSDLAALVQCIALLKASRGWDAWEARHSLTTLEHSALATWECPGSSTQWMQACQIPPGVGMA